MQRLDLNTDYNREQLISQFPLLENDNKFIVTSNFTPIYNCIAWAMGFTDRWVAVVDSTNINVMRGRFTWWPEGIEQSMRPEALKSAFEALGFVACDNYEYEYGYDKSVLYSKDGKWSHASRIVSNFEEHSKFGESWNAHHGRNKFSGSIYGDAYCCMRRLHNLKKDFLSKHTLKIGSITINSERAKPIINMLRGKLGLPPTPNL